MKGAGTTIIIRYEASSANGMSSLPTGAHATAKKRAVGLFEAMVQRRVQERSPCYKS